MKKRYYILLTLFVVTTAGIWALFYINKHHYIIWNANTIKVETDHNLDARQVKIFFGISTNSINRNDDGNVFMNLDNNTIIFDGGIRNKIRNEYGENDFLVTYDDTYYLVFRHFKIHSRAQHDYNFVFTKKNTNVILEVEIEGQDQMKFSYKMIPISEASAHRTNVPIDSAGIVYNGIELYK